MRNEGPFIVEWVSWYRMLGFQVLVVTNDCTDRSVELLETLADAGWLTHQGHTPKGRQRPKRSAYNTMRNHPLIEKAEWVLVCDVDSFWFCTKPALFKTIFPRLTLPRWGLDFIGRRLAPAD